MINPLAAKQASSDNSAEYHNEKAVNLPEPAVE
jgi:hypothetical protein